MASDNVTQFTDANFEQEVLKSNVPVLVDFWAEWCQPCRRLAPTIDKLATDYANRIKVGKLDTDANHAVASKYAIMRDSHGAALQGWPGHPEVRRTQRRKRFPRRPGRFSLATGSASQIRSPRIASVGLFLDSFSLCSLLSRNHSNVTNRSSPRCPATMSSQLPTRISSRKS